MEFLETLPPQCPPVSAVEESIETAYRVVFSDPPTLSCFASQASRKRPLMEGGDVCKHASCSLFSSYEKAKNIAFRLPKPKNSGPLLATISLPVGAGLWTSANKHIDYWFYKSFNPLSAVVGLEELS